MSAIETDHVRRESAIGLICNFARTRGANETELRSFSMARQFYTRLFETVAERTGCDLENIVYTKSHSSHYFVMTPTRDCLVRQAVVVNKDSEGPVLVRENIDAARLDALIRRTTAFPFKKGRPAVYTAIAADCEDSAPPGYADQGPRLFDFSQMRRSEEGLVFRSPNSNPRKPALQDEQLGPKAQDYPRETGPEDDLLVALLGDALIEPFWPEGLGIIRGFFGTLDVCFAISQWASGEEKASVCRSFTEAYTQLKILNAATKRSVLQQEEENYALAPDTRYRALKGAGERRGSGP